MPATDFDADPNSERLFTPATIITFVRTTASLALAVWAVAESSRSLLIAALGVYWIGDVLDGAVARRMGHETRLGAVIDILSDRLNGGAFYLGLVALDASMAAPVALYLFEFAIIDGLLSLAFLAWPIRSPNYFFVVDRAVWRWNWSLPAKAANSAIFAVFLLVTGWWWGGVMIAASLLVIKLISLRRVIGIGLPIPSRSAERLGVG